MVHEDDEVGAGFSREDNREDNRKDNQEDIEGLLELGYEQLDGFRAWVEDRLEMGSRIAEQDCFNAEFLLDYLANSQRKAISDINEYELRWFLFSYYIRKAMADEETETRLLESMERFFDYLRREHSELVPGWVAGVLDETSYYHLRRREYSLLNAEDEREWQTGFREWCTELEDDLDARILWLPREIGDGMRWGDVMGWREATLYAEATMQWQREREILLGQGYDGEAVRARLLDTFLAWVDTPQSRLEDQSPFEVIQLERLEQVEENEDSDMYDEDE